MAYWLLKTEPGDYCWDDLIRDKGTFWDGVRNYQARNNMREMKKGDQCFIYHSVGPKEIVGIARVTKEAYQDPTTDNDAWVCVDIKPVKKLKSPVHLSDIKSDKVTILSGAVNHINALRAQNEALLARVRSAGAAGAQLQTC